jgi:hypothetical protein
MPLLDSTCDQGIILATTVDSAGCSNLDIPLLAGPLSSELGLACLQLDPSARVSCAPCSLRTLLLRGQ